VWRECTQLKNEFLFEQRRKFTFSKTVLAISFDLTLFSLFLGAKSNSGWGLKASRVLVRLSCFVCARIMREKPGVREEPLT